MVKDDGEEEEVVVGGPRPRSPMREVSVDEQQRSQDGFEGESAVGSLELLAEVVLRGLGEDRGDLVLVEAVEQSLLS